MSYRFTRAWARAQILVGVLLIVGGFVAGGVALWLNLPPYPRVGTDMTSRILAAAVLVAAGFILAAPLIVSGQIILVFLDMRRRLARLDRRAGRWERERPSQEPPGVDRLRPR